MAALNRSLSEKNKEIVEIKKILSERDVLIEDYEEKVNNLEFKLKKIEKDKRSF